ncbi:uncharacterized protein N7469_003009 [Penicillium citrinum]|uniref:HPP transmembrane region domain-containing protein n=2 Tax=Penicillium TaxID=5073 RepID=A0A9W9TUT3_PENCI|nr:uncharacterized protein N7469_003009 [Penicillium citrinum]KAJ5241418.1 hypothetical protein N7469_003009 [Penicillium citrinum]KAJ5586424.1 hypothetical protein N7450_006211 [Penicillium hetheringtonii]
MADSSREGSNSLSNISSWNFDIDRFLNPLIPAPRWNLIPQPIAHFLGYRSTAPRPLGNILAAFWSLVGAFCGVALVASVSKRVPSFEDRNAPAIIGSFGAAAVIEFCAVESPFAQPRNAFFSQMIACLVGVGISKLFALNSNAENYTELGGALACGITTALMVLTRTVHPPAGATALLAVTNAQTVGLGWFLFPIMILGITLMLSAALLVNNIQRRYPLYWWTSQPLSRRHDADVESDNDKPAQVGSQYEESLTDVPRRVVVERGDIWVPNGVFVSAEERRVLDRISARL